MSHNKYGNKKLEYQGEMFDSKLELNRYLYLKQLEARGEIRNLRRQVRIQLTPSYFSVERVFSEKLNGKELKPKRREYEKNCTYICDFVYEAPSPFFNDGAGVGEMNWREVCEDTKGYATKDFIVKRKVLLHFYGKVIHSIRKPAASIPVTLTLEPKSTDIDTE